MDAETIAWPLAIKSEEAEEWRAKLLETEIKEQ
jgi:hypothetical protein